MIRWVNIAFLFSFLGATAQDSTLMQMLSLMPFDVVEVQPSRYDLLDHRELKSSDITRVKSHTVDKLLLGQPGIYIKNNGPGQVKSISIRGSGPSRSRVYWNGVDLTPGNLGQTDVSIWQMAFVDEASIDYGNSSKIGGFGGLGGALNLSTSSSFDTLDLFSFRIDYSSLSNVGTQLSWKTGQGKWYNRLAAVYRDDKNDFTYSLPQSSSRPAPDAIFASNQPSESIGLMNELGLEIGTRGELVFRSLFQHVDRVVPPLMIAPEDSATTFQLDNTVVEQLDYKHDLKRGSLRVMTAYTSYANDYESAALSAFNRAEGLRELVEYELTNDSSSLLLQARYDLDRSEPYYMDRWMSRAGFFASYTAQIRPSWKVSGNYTPQLWNGTLYGDLFTAGIGHSKKAWQANISYGSSMRTPTLNDLYWQPGGNPLLEPEQSKSIELDLEYQKSFARMFLRLGAEVDRSVIDNWIQWVPGINGFWSPMNIARVDQLGAEFNGMLSTGLHRGVVSIRANYRYQQSVSDQTGLQLIYNPVHQSNGELTFEQSRHKVSLIYRYVGERFIDQDHNQWLPAYDLIDLGYSFEWNSQQIHCEVILHNILNKSYMDVAWRAMPRFHTAFSITKKLSW